MQKRKKTKTRSNKRTKSYSSKAIASHANEVNEKELSPIYKTILIIGFVALSLFIALANFDLCGSFGNFIRGIILSCFGTLGYLFPIVTMSALFIKLYCKKFADVKLYALVFFYFGLICLLTVIICQFDLELSLSDTIDKAMKLAKEPLIFSRDKYTGGLVGAASGYTAVKFFSKAGSIIIFLTIVVASLLILFGTMIAKSILYVLKNIIFFIPNLLLRIKEMNDEDQKIAIDNENILNETIKKSIEDRLEIKPDKFGNDGRMQLDEYKESSKKKFDTSTLNISREDIQSRLFYTKDYVCDDKTNKKEKLLNEMKKKSINEMMYNDKNLNANSFFHTEGMKPINELENIVIPTPNTSTNANNITNKLNNSYNIIDTNIDNSNNEIDINTTNLNTKNTNSIMSNKETNALNDDSSDFNGFNDNSKFARGLSELQKGDGTLDYKNMTSEEILSDENAKKDIVIKNNAIKNADYVSLSNPSRAKKPKLYKYPPLNLLSKSEKKVSSDEGALREKADILVETLKQFGVGVTVTNITVGPSVTRFELKPDLGVKVAKILSLENDLKLALAAEEIRIEAPIPGKPAIGIEIPNEKSSGVLLGDIISSNEFKNAESKLTVAIGKDISGKVIVTDLRKMPHLLIAGATGSGKSVCINTLITSLIYKSSPEDVRLIMVDPKVVELQIYNGIPHLLIPVVTDARKAASSLNWAVNEMTRRYNLIQEKRVRDIESYNQAIAGEISKIGVNENNEANLEKVEKLPYIVIIIDEFADLMMVASKEVENAIMRIAQLARACGIYLVIATQRPTVNVISGSIKTNVPSRISFAVSSGIDSQTILDRRGAEKLLGHGDMLYFPQGIPEPKRVQGCYVSEDEILKIVSYVHDDNTVYNEEAEKAVDKGSMNMAGNGGNSDEKDAMFFEAGKFAIEKQNISIGLLQRRFSMGFNRAARIVDQLEAEGVISGQEGKKSREVLMTMEEFESKFG